MKTIIKKLIILCPLSLKLFVWRFLRSINYRDRNAVFFFLKNSEFDSDLLSTLIRMNASVLNKAINKTAPASGASADNLKKYLALWEENSFLKTPDIEWSEKTLKDFAAGAAAGTAPSQREANPQAVLNNLLSRRSVRLFKNSDVSKDVVEKIIEAGRWAPSSCNKQTWEIIAVKRPLGVKPDSPAAPVSLYVCLDERGYTEKYAPAMDAAAIVENMLLYANALGLGACWIYQADSVNQNSLRRRFELPEYFYVYSLVLLGHPAAEPAAPEKKRLRENVKFIGF